MYELRAVTVFACLQAPDCSVVGVGEKILLFRHQPASEELLRRLTDQDELQHGDLIEVIIAGQAATAFDLPALFKRNRSLILAGTLSYLVTFSQVNLITREARALDV